MRISACSSRNTSRPRAATATTARASSRCSAPSGICALDLPLPEIADFLKNKDVDRIEEKLRQQKQAVIECQQALQRVERRIDNRLRQLESAQHARLDEITLTRAPACRLCWIQSSLKIRSSLDMEPPIRRLEETQKDAVVFLGKVGLGITPENLYAGAYDQYDGIFLVLDEEDEFTGPVTDLPETDCLCVRFRGSHPEAPAQYRRLMACARQRGLTVTGFSREITLIDYGITDDTEKFVTEISLPVAPQA